MPPIDGGSFSSPTVGSWDNRTGKILSKVHYILATYDQGKLTDLLNNLPIQFVLDVLQNGQTRLAADLLCIEKSGTLTTVSGVASEPTGFYRAKLVKLPTGQWLQLNEVSVPDFDLLERNVIGTAEQTPLYYKRWAGSITLWPTPADTSYTFYYYGVPSTTVSSSVEPETPTYMDDALCFWTVKELSAVVNRMDLMGAYEAKFTAETERAMRMWRGTKTMALETGTGVYL